MYFLLLLSCACSHRQWLFPYELLMSCYAADLDAIFRGQKGGKDVEKSKLLLLIQTSHAGRCQYGVGKSPHGTPWGRKGNACNLRSGFCRKRGRELHQKGNLGWEVNVQHHHVKCWCFWCLLQSRMLPEATRQVVNAWRKVPCSSCRVQLQDARLWGASG